jgi:hypothetical protein
MMRLLVRENIVMQLTSKEWWKAAGIRALKTVAQTAIAIYGTTSVVTETDVKTIVVTSLTAGILSILTSVAGLPELKPCESKKDKTE